MAEISVLSRLIQGINRNVDLASNTLVVNDVKIGGASGTILSKTDLDTLIGGGSDASALHHHDGRYYTESEIGSTADGSSGASLVGIDQTPAFSNFSPSSGDVQAALEAIDTALSNAGSTTFDEANFAIYQTGDQTARAVFDLTALSTSTDRTITMPDSNVDLGQISTNQTDISTNQTDIADLQTMSGVAANSTDMGTFTGNVIPDAQTIKQALQSLETYSENSRSLIQNFEWQDSALDYITDNTATPPTESTGDRYILSHDGGTPNASWDGASAGDIVEFDGTSWVATTPTLGTFISADDEPNVLYYWGGSSWTTKAFESTTASTGLTKVGFDIQLADAALSDGITVSSGAVSITLDATPGLEFNTGALRAKVDTTGGSNLASVVDRNSNGLAVRVDDTTIEDDGNGATAQLSVKDGGISDQHINASAGIQTSKMADASELAESVTFFSNTDLTGAEAETLSDGSSADALHTHSSIRSDETAGEAFASASAPYAVRWGVTDLDTPETAGRVYKADPTELSLVKTGGNKDPFHAVGIINPGTDANASDTVTVVRSGSMTITSHGLNIGEPVWLGSGGALTSTAPTSSGEAVVKLGVAKDANTIDVDIQIMGVN